MDGGGAQTVFKETSNPGEGSASLKLVTGSCPECENYSLLFLPLPFPNPVGGFIQLGSIGEDGVAYTKRPVSVDFLYKAHPMGDDACCFHVELTKYNATTDEDELVGEAYFEVNSIVENWTHVNIPFVYSTTAQPDKLSIFICSSVGSIPDWSAIAPGMPTPSQLGLPAPVAGSEFYVDGIVFNMPSCDGFSVTMTGTNSNSYSIYSGTGSVTANVTGGNPPYSYTWNTGASTATISNLPVGTYSVLVEETNNPGCFTWGYYTVFGPGGSGISTVESCCFRMYPNPASNLIRFEGDTPLKEIEVYNAEDKLILKKKIQNTEGDLDISHFAKGLYLLKINTENGPAEAKFVKE